MKNKKDAVVILGAGIMQIPAIKAAGESGYASLVFDGNPDPVGKYSSDRFFNVDIKDYDKILTTCIENMDKYSIKGVFTAGTDFSYIVAKLAEKMGLPGISYETALKATVKSEMRTAFFKCNVSSPGFFTVEHSFEADKTEYNLDFPLVVKPVDSMGGRGSVKIETEEALNKAVENAAGFSRTGRVIIEEFIEGDEFSLDAVIENGKIFICGIADRHIFFPPYFVEMGHTMPSISPPEIQEKVISVFEDGIKAIGITNGTAKGDIKYSGDKAVVGEIAARLSGGYMSGWTFPYSTGVSVIKAALNVAVGKPSGLKPFSYTRTAAERAFISIPGTVSQIVIPEYLEEGKRPDEIKDVFINIEKGEKVVFPKNNVQKCGNIIAVHREREKAVYASEQACRDIIVRLESCNTDTEKFLFHKKEKWVPDAFVINQPENMEAVRIMDKIVTSDSHSTKTAVSVIPFPEREDSVDWMGRGFAESFNNVIKLSGAELQQPGREYRVVLGKLFWDAFTAGGIQGGLWLIETVEKYMSKGALPDRFR